MSEGSNLIGGTSNRERAENDFYATNPETVKRFLARLEKDNQLKKIFDDATIWECACGNGNIVKAIKDFFIDRGVYPKLYLASDLVDRGYGVVKDFLKTDYKADVIITNPPFKYLNEFILRGLKQANKYLILFAKIQTLETVKRVEILQISPLKYVYIHSKRECTWRNGNSKDENGKEWTSTMCMAWFVWEKGYKGEPIIRWI